MNFSVYWQHADAVSKTLYFILYNVRLQRGRFFSTYHGYTSIKTTRLMLNFHKLWLI